MAALHDPYVTQMLLQAFMTILFVGGLFGLAIGAGLLLNTAAMLQFFARMNRWVSTRRSMKPVEIPRGMDNQVPADATRRWIAGAIFAAGGAYAGFVLGTRIDVMKVIWAFGIEGQMLPIAAILMDTVRWFLVVGCAGAVLIGVLLLFFPGAWRAVEALGNRWYSTRQLIAGGDSVHLTLDRWVELFPRAAGAIIVVLSLVPALTAGVLLFGRAL
jgi:hypothetical protein